MIKLRNKLLGFCLAVLAAVCLLLGLSFAANTSKAISADATTNYYDSPVVYDMSDLSLGLTEIIPSASYDMTLGQLPTTDNVAVQFTFKKGSSLQWNEKILFLKSTGGSHSEANAYLVYFHYEGSAKVAIEESGVRVAAFDYAIPAEEVLVEIGTYNVYGDAEKQNQVARMVYVKVNGEVVATYYDETLKVAGSYVSAPVYDGTFGSAGYLKTTKAVYNVSATISGEGNGSVNTGTVLQGGNYEIKVTPDAVSKVTAFTVNGEDKLNALVDSGAGYYTYTVENAQSNIKVTANFSPNYYHDDVVVYDISDLSLGLTEFIPSASYDMTLGQLPATENVAVQFLFKKGSTLQWNEKILFLKSTDNSHSEANAYLIYFHYEGAAKVVIEESGVRVAAFDYAIPAEEVLVEIGTYNVYDDVAKQNQIARMVYVKVNGEVVATYYDETLEVAGSYVSAPVYDGTFGYAGYLKTTKDVYNVTATISGDGNGVVNTGTVLQGGNYEIKVTPDAVSKVTAFTVNGEDKLNALVDSGAGYYTYTIENAQSNIVITATFNQIYYYDNVTISDIYELTEKFVEFIPSASYEQTLGQLPATENVAVQFLFQKGSSLQWHEKILFLKSTGNSHSEANAYLIYFHYEGAAKVAIEESGVRVAAFDYAIPAEEVLVEIGTYNVYDDVAKQNQIARMVYVKVNGEVVATYYDETLKVAGSYVSAPVYDGTFGSAGYLKTTKVVYNVTATTSGDGDGSVNTGIAVKGAAYEIKVTPDAISKVTAFTVNGEDKLNALVDTGAGYYTYTVENVQSDIEITASFGPKYFHDDASVYDLYDFSSGLIDAIPSDSYDMTLGQLPATENVAIQFLFKKGTSVQWNEKILFLKSTGGSHSEANAYLIYFHYEGAAKVAIEESGVRVETFDYAIPAEEVLVEIGTYNVYDDVAKQNQVARMIYVKVNGEIVATYYDETLEVAGSYVSAPVYDGTFGNPGYLMTTKNVYFVEVKDAEGNIYFEQRLVESKDCTVQINLEKGETVQALTMDGTAADVVLANNAAGVAFVIENISANYSYILSKNTGVKATISLADMKGCLGTIPTEVLIRDKVEFTLTLPVGKILSDIKNNGVSILDYVTVERKEVYVNIPVVYGNVDLTIELQEKTFTVTIHTVDNGMVTASTSSPMAHEDVTLQLAVNEGYIYEYVKVNGAEVRLQADGSYVIKGVLEDIVVEYKIVAMDVPSDEPGNESSDNPSSQPGVDSGASDENSSAETPSSNGGDDSKSKGCGSTISSIGFVAMVLVLCATVYIVKFKGKYNDESKEESIRD